MKHLPFIALALAFAACGPSVGANVDAKAGSADAAVDGHVGPDANLTDAPLTEESKVYAHSGKQLYRIDTTTTPPTPILIGTFTDTGTELGTASITDIAVDKNGNMMGCTLKKIFTINPTTAAVTHVADLPSGAQPLTSLSYVPKDLSDTTKGEILVAADNDGNILEINPATGVTSPLGVYGMSGANVIRSSGDIVAIYGEGIFATVNVGNDFATNDYLAKIDPVTWNATLVGGDLGVDKAFGLAYWRTKLYVFSGFPMGVTTGKVIEVDPKTGAVTPGAIDGTIDWFGAGVTTIAPIIVN